MIKPMILRTRPLFVAGGRGKGEGEGGRGRGEGWKGEGGKRRRTEGAPENFGCFRTKTSLIPL